MQTKIQTFSFFCGLQVAIVVISHSDNLNSILQRAELRAVDAQKNAKLSVTVLRGIRSDRDASLHWTKVTQAAVKLELQAPSFPCCTKTPSRYFEDNAQTELYSNVEDIYHHIYKAMDTVANSIVEHFNLKDYIMCANCEQVLQKGSLGGLVLQNVNQLGEFYTVSQPRTR